MQLAPFVIPRNIPEDKQVDYCLNTLDKYRKELQPLRRHISDLLRWRDHWREKAIEWEEKYKKSQQENREIVKENEKLKKERDRLEKENNRYRIALFDHGNFKKFNRSKKNIVINPEVVRLILESERQWCSVCNKEVHARDEHSLPFTEYGINTDFFAEVNRSLRQGVREKYPSLC